MGYVKEKYDYAYFMHKKNGKKTKYGCDGLQEFLNGSINKKEASILKKIDFNNKTVLDIGFGRGESIKWAVQNGASKVIGVDFSFDAVKIASDFLLQHNVSENVILKHDDILLWLKSEVNISMYNKKIDIVIMFEAIEHIPRKEMKEILRLLKKFYLSEKGIIALCTSWFKVDNDILKEGLKEEAMDSSDKFIETQGMHCNRYTKKSLKKFMFKNGFLSIYSFNPLFFVKKRFKDNFIKNDGYWEEFKDLGYPIV